MTWMIYGANGYTGALIAQRAVDDGELPVLAGRNGEAVSALARRLGLPYEVFDLDDTATVDRALKDIDVVAHCAGPFSTTALPMVHACLRSRTHYVDLTGEVDVFESIYALHDRAVAVGVTLVPGVGFDVVPTEYLAVSLAHALPSATHIDIALVSRGGFSPGTLKTGIEGIRRGGRIRRGGQLVPVRLGHRSRRIRLANSEVTVHSVPLGDISAAFRSTGIPNITNFTVVPLGRFAHRADPLLRTVLRAPVIASTLIKLIARSVPGPSGRTRAATHSELWAEARDDHGVTKRALLRVPNTYEFTVASTLLSIRLLTTTTGPAGAWTPSQAFGDHFLETVPGTTGLSRLQRHRTTRK
ncbi:saccharopine dehydrogenase family protein [Mycobacteroides abscessus]|uniref:saccharopine dehydrogenase family protein n=1 Tax=Mycobacteroides abscessus TaxID=36809 RepID=UPI00030DF6D3|nr:saccharopine dehydrogenase NADP-binding domain-containing protein [Mycobacteroides abscessus]